MPTAACSNTGAFVIYLGIDWSKSEIVVAVSQGGAKPRHLGSFDRSRKGVEGLVRRLRKQGACGADAIVGVIEAGAPGWQALLHDAGIELHVADPKQAKSFAASLGSSGAKDDRRDAAALCLMAQSPVHRGERWTPHAGVHAQLVVLSKGHQTLSEESTRARQRLRALLREENTAVEALIRSLDVHWCHALLQAYPTAWHLAAATPEALDAVLGGTRCPMDKRAALVQVLADARRSSWQSEGLAQVQGLVIQQLLTQVSLLKAQLKVLDDRIDACLQQLTEAQHIMQINGIGRQLTARILRFLGPLEGSGQRDHASIALGVAPVFQGSGTDRMGRPKGQVRMRKSVDPHARATGYLLGRLATQNLDWARAKYADALARGKNSATAYRIVARSMLRIITAIQKTGQPYDHDRYVRRLKANGVPWAMGLG
ncbi:MAG: IS110 family transposase [Myxococcota bacterium]|nr:IS110 family transposase [Myxococcota bacterium]